MTRRPLPALFASLGVLAFLVAKEVVTTGSNWLQYVSAGAPGDWMHLSWFGLGLLSSVVIAVGVFLALWLVLPVRADGTLPATIASGALAAVGGALTSAVMQLLQALVFARSVSGSLYDLVPLGIDPRALIAGAISTAVTLLPLTVLAAFLLREWLKSRASVPAAATPVDAV